MCPSDEPLADRSSAGQSLAERCAAAMWDADGASQALGIEITLVAPGRATATMGIRPDMVNGHAIAHGGYIFLLADTAFAFACNTYGEVTVARAADIAFLAPVHQGDELVAHAQVRTQSGRNGIYDVTVTRSGHEVVAEFRGHSRATGRALPD